MSRRAIPADSSPSEGGAPPPADGSVGLPGISIVVIGKNEGLFLERCFESILAAGYPRNRLELIYVDSGSTDESVNLARRFADRVIAARIDRPRPGLARNLGWKHATHGLVQFVDGDSILQRGWLQAAVEAVKREQGTLCVFGALEELRPEANVFHRALSFDWEAPAEPRTSGGIALFPRARLTELGGFDETLEAGEEPDLCTRGRLAGYRLLSLDSPMARHDLDMRSFRAYWRRGVRSGQAYALIGTRFAGTPVPLWRNELRRNFIQLGVLLAALVPLGFLIGPLGAIGSVAAVIVVLVARKFFQARTSGRPVASRLAWAVHVYLVKLPIWYGHLHFFLGKLLGIRRAASVEILECWSREAKTPVDDAHQCQADQSPVPRT